MDLEYAIDVIGLPIVNFLNISNSSRDKSGVLFPDQFLEDVKKNMPLDVKIMLEDSALREVIKSIFVLLDIQSINEA